MGGTQSASKGQVLAQAHQQPQEPPYPGPSAQYQFVNMQVTMSARVSFGFMNSSMTTSNVDAYYPLIAQQYDQGYRMLSFYHIPGQVTRTALFSRDVQMPFQGIFCRYPQVPSNERFMMRIEKSVIQPQMVWNGWISARRDVVTDTSHLFQTIANNTQNGGRLVCIELTGAEETRHTYNPQHRMPIMGCDLFFEIPVNGGENYQYNVVCVPITVSMQASFSRQVMVQCDWYGVLAQNLGQGYKLVEIFMDQTQSTVSSFSATTTLNSQWFFEKPVSRLNDLTPVYQGTIVEHWIHISAGFSGTRTDANWETTIQNMGNKGWELACILETPEVQLHGIGSQMMKVLLFFQRRIIY